MMMILNFPYFEFRLRWWNFFVRERIFGFLRWCVMSMSEYVCERDLSVSHRSLSVFVVYVCESSRVNWKNQEVWNLNFEIRIIIIIIFYIYNNDLPLSKDDNVWEILRMCERQFQRYLLEIGRCWLCIIVRMLEVWDVCGHWKRWEWRITIWWRCRFLQGIDTESIWRKICWERCRCWKIVARRVASNVSLEC